MKITEVRINKYENKNIKAFATVTFDNVLVVSGFSVVTGKNGLFVSCPNSKGKDGNYHDTVYPITAEGRKALNDKIIESYNKASDGEFKNMADSLE